MKRIVFFALLFVLFAAAFSYVRWRTTRYDYLIARGSAKYGLDFHLVKSLIYEESWFNSRARGRAGEVGLMQITPVAADDYRRAIKVQIRPEDLDDPEVNLEVGCWYLRASIDRYKDFEDPLPYALARYNAGEVRVNKWLERPLRDHSEPAANFLARIEYPGTRQYVKNILRRYALQKYYF
ncbi:MAG: lytic transglycosylase domain-containing protein [Acidobacteria bacterium]|nr:lytic transglycosylase domain-containing protein [Acidobacteriota bacterium]